MTAPVRFHRRGGGPALDDYLRRWLQTCPGAFHGRSEHRCLETALGYFLPHHLGDLDAVSLDDFADSLARAGHRPSERTRHGGFRRETYWVLALPER